MAPTFEELTLEEFAALVDRFEFTRRIDAVHMHHTWQPDAAAYHGLATIQSMWEFHVKTKGWSDIAQHVSIAPGGTIWLGRDWNRPPASATGFNGTAQAGPFMFETIGNFDVGEDALTPSQHDAVLLVIAKMWERFALPSSSLRFHREMNPGKSCPGTGIDKDRIVAEATAKLVELRKTRRAVNRALRWSGNDALPAFGRAQELARTLKMAERRTAERGAAAVEDGELEEGRTVAGARSRGSGLDAAMLAALRPHVVTLHDGRFAGGGELPTTEADVDRIFDRHLVDWQREHPGQPLRIMLWAHGGLVDEANGLRKAHELVQWWKLNEIYPIHFVWHTGILDALQQLLFGPRDRALRAERARDVFDYTTDPGIEFAARGLGVPRLWDAMKRSAELSSATQGGATYLATRLAQFCRGSAGVEIYAAGHSAGSVFHAYFLPTALGAGVPAIRDLFLLAPAVRTDLFHRTLAPIVGSRIQRLTMLTMSDALERDDSIGPYRKSLLYLVSRALEGDRREDILGLDSSVRADAELTRLFGGSSAEIVWSDGRRSSDPNLRSTSTSHGGFDDDGPTMDTLIYRATGAVPRHPFKKPPSRAVATPVRTTAAGQRRRAFCVGIDDYPAPNALSGCVNDMREWQAALEALGFDVTACENGAATREAILAGLDALIAGSRAGDVLVFQYAGHGTNLDDLDGDEEDGQDEAFVPVDFGSGAFLLDDDVWTVMGRLPEGVNLTCFVDCCHSGSITRVLAGPPTPGPIGARARFIAATPDMQAAHRSFRSLHRGATRGAPARRREDMGNIVFAACRDDQVAYEIGGHGAFTTRAVPLLRGDLSRLTYEGFQTEVTQAFGPSPQQSPRLDCADRMLTLPFLAPFGATSATIGAGMERPVDEPPRTRVDPTSIADHLRAIAELLDGRR